MAFSRCERFATKLEVLMLQTPRRGKTQIGPYPDAKATLIIARIRTKALIAPLTLLIELSAEIEARSEGTAPALHRATFLSFLCRSNSADFDCRLCPARPLWLPSLHSRNQGQGNGILLPL